MMMWCTLSNPVMPVSYGADTNPGYPLHQLGTLRSSDGLTSTLYIWKMAMAANTFYYRLLNHQSIGPRHVQQLKMTQKHGQNLYMRISYPALVVFLSLLSTMVQSFRALLKYCSNSMVLWLSLPQPTTQKEMQLMSRVIKCL